MKHDIFNFIPFSEKVVISLRNYSIEIDNTNRVKTVELLVDRAKSINLNSNCYIPPNPYPTYIQNVNICVLACVFKTLSSIIASKPWCVDR